MLNSSNIPTRNPNKLLNVDCPNMICHFSLEGCRTGKTTFTYYQILIVGSKFYYILLDFYIKVRNYS